MRTFTIAEAAELTGLSRKAIARRVERGSLRSVVRNGRRRIPRSELVRAGLLAEDDEGTPNLDPGALLLPRPAPGGLETAGRQEDLLATLVRELLDRLERQSGEMAQLRALTVEAESLRLTNELAELRGRIAELEGDRPGTGATPHTAEVSSRINELSRQVEELAARGIWLPPHARPHPGAQTHAQRFAQAASPAPMPAQTPSAPQTTPAPVPQRPGRRIARFFLEAVFLVGVALVAWQVGLSPLAIGAAMAVAWVVVALVEWAASRPDRPQV